MIKIFITDWFRNLFNLDGTVEVDGYAGTLSAELFMKELAVQACVNLIANAVSRSEFLTYDKGLAVRNDNYYLFNVEPNQNKSSSKFWRDMVHKLVYENECLVIQQNGMFYVAESFTTVKYAFKENIYKDVVVEEYALNKNFKESDIMHFELHDQAIKILIEGIYSSYGNLIAYSKDNYKRSNAKRGTLDVPTSYPQTEKAQEQLELLLSKRFKKFFEAEGGAVLPLTNGLKYTDLATTGYKTGSDSRDIRALVDDVFDYTAIAFQIPPQLLKGTVADTDKVISNFLTFCVNPIAELITDEINRKYYGKKAFLEKTYVKLDTTRITNVNIKDIANALDILTRVGIYCVDDSLKALGMEPLDTEYSRQRWMTKNYSPIEQAAKGITAPVKEVKK